MKLWLIVFAQNLGELKREIFSFTLRLASLNTETDDTSDGSDKEYRATRLETNNDR